MKLNLFTEIWINRARFSKQALPIYFFPELFSLFFLEISHTSILLISIKHFPIVGGYKKVVYSLFNFVFIHFDGCCVMSVHAHVCMCLCVLVQFSAPVSVGKYCSSWDEVRRLSQYWLACLPPSLWQDPMIRWGIHKDVYPLSPKEPSVSTSHLAIWVLR